MTRTPTHCPYCALQCGQWIDRAGAVDAREFPTSRGGMCQKGWTSGRLLRHPERLTTPLVHGEPVSWDAALGYVADRLRAIRTEHGPDAVAVFGAGGLTNEKAYLLGKFARVALGTSQIDYNGRFCMSSAAAATNRAFGLDRGLPFPITDVARADAILLAGGNLAETMPPFVRHLTRMREAGGRLIVVDPRRTPTARQADLHLQITPGTDLALALGLLHIAIAEGLVDEDYIERRTTGFDAVRTSVSAWWPERAERVTGIPVAQMRETVRTLAAARNAMILTGRGAEQHAHGVDTVTAWINVALVLGLPGVELGGDRGPPARVGIGERDDAKRPQADGVGADGGGPRVGARRVGHAHHRPGRAVRGVPLDVYADGLVPLPERHRPHRYELADDRLGRVGTLGQPRGDVADPEPSGHTGHPKETDGQSTGGRGFRGRPAGPCRAPRCHRVRW